MTHQVRGPAHARVEMPRLSALETLRVWMVALGPVLAQGVIVRRPRMVALAEKLDADRRAGRLLQDLRDRYGPGPVRLRVPGRSVALVLSAADVQRVLEESPEPFTPASMEKRAALSHFQPDGVLISQGRPRQERRQVNEAALDTHQPVHRLAGSFQTKVREEARQILAAAGESGQLGWAELAAGWWALVRRVVLGDAARDDHEVTDLLTELRQDANWAYLRRPREELRERFMARLRTHLRRAEPDSLAGMLADIPGRRATDREGQVPHWLFAFDAAGIAAFRTLALLATHPAHRARAREELSAWETGTLRYLRACVQESVRLWPTTPVVLRDSTTETMWPGGVLPAGTAFLILSSFFHRDEWTLPYADRLTPEIWLDGRASDGPLIPFSAGPAACAGRNLVLFLTSSLLAALLDAADFRLLSPRLDHRHPLPRTLNHFSLRFATRRLES